MKHIGIFQIWGLGDLVMTVPAIAEIRMHFPGVRLTLFVRGPVQAGLMSGSPLVDDIVIVPRNESVLKQLRFFAGLRKSKLDAAFIGTRTSPWLAALLRYISRVPTIVGDAQRFRRLYTRAGPIEPRTHRVDRMLHNLSLWTATPAAAAAFPLPISAAGANAAYDLMASARLTDGPFIAIHPGSSGNLGKEKRLPAALVSALAENVSRHYPDTHIAIVLGPDDLDLQPVYDSLGPNISVLKNMPIDVTKFVLRNAACFVGSDSALGHIAAAFGVPAITIAGPTDPDETRPYGAHAAILTRPEKLACQPCWGTPLQGRCPYDARCMREVPPDALYSAVRAVLADRMGSRKGVQTQ